MRKPKRSTHSINITAPHTGATGDWQGKTQRDTLHTVTPLFLSLSHFVHHILPKRQWCWWIVFLCGFFSLHAFPDDSWLSVCVCRSGGGFAEIFLMCPRPSSYSCTFLPSPPLPQHVSLACLPDGPPCMQNRPPTHAHTHTHYRNGSRGQSCDTLYARVMMIVQVISLCAAAPHTPSRSLSHIHTLTHTRTLFVRARSLKSVPGCQTHFKQNALTVCNITQKKGAARG